MTISGLLIHIYDISGLTKEAAHNIKELHELLSYAVSIFVPLHIAGVFVAEVTCEPGIVSNMINGGKISITS